MIDVPASLIAASVKRPGFVGAQHVHGAEIVDGGEALHDHALPASRFAPSRQRHRDDHRQELGREADREREREQQRIQQGPMEHHIGDHDEQNEEDRNRSIKKPNWRIPRANASRGRSVARPCASPPSSVSRPVRHTSAVAVPLIAEVPMNTKFEAPDGSSAGGARSAARFSTG